MVKMLQEQIQLNKPFKIENGHINTLIFKRMNNIPFPNNKTESITVTYHSEKDGNTKTVLDKIPVGYFYDYEVAEYKVDLGSVYLEGNGYLEVTFNLTEAVRPPEQSDDQYSQNNLMVFTESLKKEGFHFNHYKMTDEKVTLKNTIKIDAFCGGSAQTNYQAQSDGYTSNLFSMWRQTRNSYQNLYTSLTGIPNDVTVTIQAHHNSESSFVIGTSLYFPIGEINKEMFKNLTQAEKEMRTFESEEDLQSIAMIRCGFGYTSDYYKQLRNTLT